MRPLQRDHLVLHDLTTLDLIDGPQCRHLPLECHPAQAVQFARECQRHGMIDEIVTACFRPVKGHQVTVECSDNGTDVDLSFGARATLKGSTIGTITCDKSSMIRGDVTCPK